MKKIILVTFTVLTGFAFSQKSESKSRNAVLKEKGIVIEKKDLELLSDESFKLVSNYDFDQYRFENIEKKVQLVNGPLIVLQPFKELKKNKKSENDYEKNKLVKRPENFKHELILQLNIGLGAYTAPQDY